MHDPATTNPHTQPNTAPSTAPSTEPHAAPHDGYTWPTCVGCNHKLWDTELGRYACRPCQDKAEQHLAELGGLFAALDVTTALIPGTRRSNSTPNPPTGGPTAGRAHAPMPLRIDVLDLAAAGGIATRLGAIEDAWRTVLGWTLPVTTDGKRVYAAWRAAPHTTITGHLTFLRNNLLWACSSYNEVAQDLEELRHLHTQATHALAGTPRPGRIEVGTCPTPTHALAGPGHCGTQLTATTAGGTIRCPTCHTTWADLNGLRELRKAQHALTEADRALEAAAA
jgi:hypothetical protein